MKKYLQASTLILIILCFLTYTVSSQGISGTYTTNFGDMTLQQNGYRVNGTYEASQNGTLSGTLQGNILRGTWDQGNNYTGYFEFVFTNNFSEFDGKWGTDVNMTSGSWYGSKEGGVSQPTHQPVGANINCHTLFGLGKLVANMELSAYQNLNSSYIVTSINYALDHISASNCLSSDYLVSLKSRISGTTNSSSFYNEIRDYSLSLDTEISSSCACCSSCRN